MLFKHSLYCFVLLTILLDFLSNQIPVNEKNTKNKQTNKQTNKNNKQAKKQKQKQKTKNKNKKQTKNIAADL